MPLIYGLLPDFCKCYNMVAWRKSLKSESSSHLKEKPYICGRCRNYFSPEDNIIVHDLIPTLTILDTFNIVNKCFITKQYLTTHKPAMGEDIYCGVNKTFLTNECLTSQRVSPKENFYPCSLCSKSFQQQRLLTAHYLAHTFEVGPPPPAEFSYFCSVCKQVYSQYRFLLLHMHEAHNSWRFPYICSICNVYVTPYATHIHYSKPI